MSANDSTASVSDRNTEKGVTAANVGNETREALGKLLQSFRPYLLTVAGEALTADLRGKCGASDVVQDTFREAHRDWNGFRGKTVHEVRAWLRRILLNNIRDVAKEFRHAKRNTAREIPIRPESPGGLVDPEPTPCTRVAAQEQTSAVAQAIAGLPDDYRRVIELKSRENWTFPEIGRELGRSPDAARMLWFRAIETLRRELVGTDGARARF